MSAVRPPSENYPQSVASRAAGADAPSASGSGDAYILIGQGEGERFELSKPETSIGRAPDNDIRIDQPEVSRFHAQITQREGAYWLSDLGSSNGTFVNDSRVAGTLELRDGDHVSFGSILGTFHHTPRFDPAQTSMVAVGSIPREMDMAHTVAEIDIPDAVLAGEDDVIINLVKDETVIGRVPGNDLVVADPFVSRQHAKIQRRDADFVISDLESSNGTYVNGERLTGPHVLQPGDEVRIGHLSYEFQFLKGQSERRAIAAFPVAASSAVTGKPTIEIADVQKRYKSGDGDVPVLQGITLTIREGDFVSVVGPSGSGKSTLINMLTGIDQPDSGKVVVYGQDIGALNENNLARWRGKTVGLIFQFFQLLPTLSAVENVMLPMDFCKTYTGSARRKRAMEVLSLVGMDAYANRLPSAMSGGQQQRVAIARALANDPPIIVGDEPTGNLDSATAQQVFSLLRRLAEEGKTVVFVTHDPLLARSTQRKIEILDGRIVNEDVPAVAMAVAGH